MERTDAIAVRPILPSGGPDFTGAAPESAAPRRRASSSARPPAPAEAPASPCRRCRATQAEAEVEAHALVLRVALRERAEARERLRRVRLVEAPRRRPRAAPRRRRRSRERRTAAARAAGTRRRTADGRGRRSRTPAEVRELLGRRELPERGRRRKLGTNCGSPRGKFGCSRSSARRAYDVSGCARRAGHATRPPPQRRRRARTARARDRAGRASCAAARPAAAIVPGPPTPSGNSVRTSPTWASNESRASKINPASASLAGRRASTHAAARSPGVRAHAEVEQQRREPFYVPVSGCCPRARVTTVVPAAATATPAVIRYSHGRAYGAVRARDPPVAYPF